MVVVDLITGFLGAGKTTFIHKYLHFLQRKGLEVLIIENEFGDVSIDTELLKEETCEILDLSGMCMCCTGKEAFIQMLKESASKGYEHIIVEPSGIYDVDEFFEVMSLPEISELCEIGSIITIIDPYGMEYSTEESEYLMFGQLLASGMVLMSKTQSITQEQLEHSVHEIEELMKRNGCDQGLAAELMTKDWDSFTEEDMEDIWNVGYFRMVHDRECMVHSEIFRSINSKLQATNRKEIFSKISLLFESPSCGIIYRIKGYAKDSEGQFYEVNCTPGTMYVEPVEEGREVIVIIGQYLRKEDIREVVE